MPATVTGSKTVTTAKSPALSAAVLTTLLATAIENLTVAQFNQIRDAIKRTSGGGNPKATIGNLLT